MAEHENTKHIHGGGSAWIVTMAQVEELVGLWWRTVRKQTPDSLVGRFARIAAVRAARKA
jgi:hypothetical protein